VTEIPINSKTLTKLI